ncbi:MAG: protein phosphatase 2C domain-containing protein [Planctomycetales bacterium]|nr:protein phosphatase 2C domain-containing protein [Planctomycetales bacterium]
MPALSAASFWLPKAGGRPEDYEDASATDAAAGRFAVADGASETMFAGPWARQLVERTISEPPPDGGEALAGWLQPLQEEWDRGRAGASVPWYAEEKLKAGAYAALLGVEVDAAAGRWRAFALGDCCLVGVRRNKVAAAFPIETSAEFHNRPVLLSSVAASNEGIWDRARRGEGDAQPGDVLFLMTDALAEWFLRESELRRKPWGSLRGIRAPEQFASFLDLLRRGGAIRNDDSTLVRVEVT